MNFNANLIGILWRDNAVKQGGRIHES
jgi:hypothetical protein